MPVMVGPREYQRLNFGLLFAAFLSISSFKDGNCLKLLYSLQARWNAIGKLLSGIKRFLE